MSTHRSLRMLLFLALFPALLFSGCPTPVTTGQVYVLNDLPEPLLGLYITRSDDSSWGSNRITAPVATGYRIRFNFAPGLWDALTVNDAGQYREIYGINLEAGKTVTVAVSAMQPVDTGDEEEIIESSGPHELTGGLGLEIGLNDGTLLTLPPLPGEGNITALTLETVTGEMDLGPADLAQTGTTRILHFDSFDPLDLGINPSAIRPSLIIPASDFAGIDPDTLALARVADLYIDGIAMPGHVSTLPLQFTPFGDLLVTDFYFTDSMLSDLAYREDAGKAAQTGAQPDQSPIWPREIRYIVGTFKDSYNWDEHPALIRFYPDDTAGARRLLFADLSEERRNEEARKTIRQALVLVHGHNEEEKLGAAATTAPAPWRFGYKRDVWTIVYDYILDSDPDLLECTAFYEFIYPTYKPIFTPHRPGQRQDEHFATAVNTMVAGWGQNQEEFELYIVGHSQGGVVARAGIQLFQAPAHQAFQKLVTWGSPHMGSPLVSLRYVLGAPDGIYRAGPDGVVNFPLGNINNTLFALRRAVDDLQVDAPGTRDLRWANSHTTTPYGLALESLFSFDVNAAVEPELWRRYDLRNGTDIYSENLRLLNADDTYRLSGKYHALYGVTSKRSRITFPLLRWFRPTIEGTGTELGALVMPWLIDGADQGFGAHVRGSSDGAVPVVSMAGAGSMGAARDIGDIDHEEYFGAPEPHGQFQEPHLAWTTARETLVALRMTACPPLPPPGQRTFALSRSSTETLTGFLGAVDADGNSVNLRFDQTVNLNIIVNFDGVREPELYRNDWEPERLWHLFVPGYRNPVTVNGQRNYTISPDSFQRRIGATGVDYYTLRKAEFEQHVTGTVNERGFQQFIWEFRASGEPFTFIFNDPRMVSPLPGDFEGFTEFNFSSGVFMLTWNVAEYRYGNFVREYEWEQRTYVPYSVPSPLAVHFRLNYRSD